MMLTQPVRMTRQISVAILNKDHLLLHMGHNR
jgi:hypothetical protein